MENQAFCEFVQIGGRVGVFRFTTLLPRFIAGIALFCNTMICPVVVLAQFGTSSLIPTEEQATIETLSDDRVELETKWEKLLHRQCDSIGIQEQTYGALLAKLHEIGLPMEIDQSALFDECDVDDLISVNHRSLSLYTRLQIAFKKCNATIAMARGSIAIVSLSNAHDPEHRSVRTYDVSGMGQNVHDIIDVIESLFNDDKWCLPHDMRVIPFSSNKKNVIIVQAAYFIQVEVDQLFKTLRTDPGLGVNSTLSRPIGERGDKGSEPVELPIDDRDARKARPGGVF